MIANTVAGKIWNGVLLLLRFAYFKVTGNTIKANIAMKAFNRTTKTNPIMFLVSLLITAKLKKEWGKRQ